MFPSNAWPKCEANVFNLISSHFIDILKQCGSFPVKGNHKSSLLSNGEKHVFQNPTNQI